MTRLRAVVTALLVTACAEPVTHPEPIIRPVRFQVVQADEGGRTRTFAGTAQAGTESKLSFRVAGALQKLHVKAGDRVEAGDPIGELDPRDYKLQVQDAQAAMAQARAGERNADTAYARIQALYANRSASAQDLDAARAQRDSARASVQSIRQKLELARQQERYTRLTAPTDGAISHVGAEVNENVSPGQPVVVLSSGKRPEVLTSVPEVLIAQVEKDMAVTIRFDAIPGKTFTGRTTEVGITGAGATYPVTVTLDEADPAVRARMAAEVDFPFEVKANGNGARFVVPPFAVGEDRQGRHVFIVKPGAGGFGIVERRPVTVGALTDRGFEVTTGLSAGDLLVTAGVSKLEHGKKVRVRKDTTAAAAVDAGANTK